MGEPLGALGELDDGPSGTYFRTYGSCAATHDGELHLIDDWVVVFRGGMWHATERSDEEEMHHALQSLLVG